MNAVLIIDKPGGMTSHDVVEAVRRIVRGPKVGHAGALDPNATGILIILMGRATKISRFLMGLEKEYVFTLELGVETNTLDRWGEVVNVHCADHVGEDQILAAASRFKGKYQQVAPSVSALKHKGARLYKLTRRGEAVPEKTRVVVIKDFQVMDVCHPLVTIRVVCSSGTYVRSLARDMGRYLGCGASVFCLRRVRVGSFRLEQAVNLHELINGDVNIRDSAITIEESLRDLPRVTMNRGGIDRIRVGGQPSAEDLSGMDIDFEGDYVAITDETGIVVGIARRSDKPGRLLETERIL